MTYRIQSNAVSIIKSGHAQLRLAQPSVCPDRLLSYVPTLARFRSRPEMSMGPGQILLLSVRRKVKSAIRTLQVPDVILHCCATRRQRTELSYHSAILSCCLASCHPSHPSSIPQQTVPSNPCWVAVDDHKVSPHCRRRSCIALANVAHGRTSPGGDWCDARMLVQEVVCLLTIKRKIPPSHGPQIYPIPHA